MNLSSSKNVAGFLDPLAKSISRNTGLRLGFATSKTSFQLLTPSIYDKSFAADDKAGTKEKHKQLADNLEDALKTKQRLFLTEKSLFAAMCLPEFRVVSRLLNKFSFVNEDILRTQVLNELSHFTNRDKIYLDLRLGSTLSYMEGGPY